MDQAAHNKIVSFVWGIADDVLRRFDAVLEPTKKSVLETKEMLDKQGITEQRAALCDAAGQAFYNTSRFSLRDLKSRGSEQQLRQDFENYLDGFSQNVQDILMEEIRADILAVEKEAEGLLDDLLKGVPA